MRKRLHKPEKVYATSGPYADLYEENRRLDGKLRHMGVYDEDLPKSFYCLFLGTSIIEVSKEEAKIMNARELTLPQAREWASQTSRKLCLKK